MRDGSGERASLSVVGFESRSFAKGLKVFVSGCLSRYVVFVGPFKVGNLSYFVNKCEDFQRESMRTISRKRAPTRSSP